MTRRSGDWELLGHSGDPVPADGSDVRAVARAFDDRARTLDEAQRVLDRLSRLDGWTGEAAERFAAKASESLEDLEKARDKYADVATALRGFAADVDSARSDSFAALQRAVEGDEARRRNAGDPFAGVLEPTPEQVIASAKTAEDHQHGLDEVAAARRDLERALKELDAAAHRAKSTIGTASDRFSDSWWDHVKGVVRDVADQIDLVIKVLEIAAIVIAVAALAVAIVATGGAAGVLLALFWAGVGVSLTTAALRTALVMSDSGKATWGDVIWDAANAVLCFGGGKLATAATRSGATVVARVAASGEAAAWDLASDGLATNARNALGIRNVSNPLRMWATRELETAARPGLEAIERATTLRASLGRALMRLSRENANIVMRLRSLRELDIPGSEEALRQALNRMAVAQGINLANLASTADAVLDQVDLNPSMRVKRAINGSLEDLQRSGWRLTVAGR